MPALLRAIDRACEWAAAAACVALAAIVALVLAEVFARKFLATSLDFAWEWAAYLTAVAFTLGMGRALRTGQHVRVRLVLDALPARAGRVLDIAGVAGALALAGYLAWALARLAWVSHLDGTRSFLPSNTLLWPFQAAFALGAALFALQLLAYLIRSARREPPEVAES